MAGVLLMDGCDWPLVVADIAARYTSSATINSTNHALPTGQFGGNGIGLRPGTNGSLNVTTKQLTDITSVRMNFGQWVRLTNTGPYTAGSTASVFQADGTSGTHACITFEPFTDLLALRLGGEAGSIIHSTTYNLDDGNLHWIEWVYVGDDWQGESHFYVDGTEITAITVNFADAVKTSQTDASGVATYSIKAQKRTTGQYVDVDFDDLVIYDWTSTYTGRAGVTANIGSNPLTKFGTTTPGVNFYIMIKVTAKAGVTYNQLRWSSPSTNGTSKYKAFIYPDVAGSPDGQTLLRSSNEVTGITASEQKINFTASYTPSVDTDVWIGVTVITTAIDMRTNSGQTVRFMANGGADTPAGTCPASTSSSAGWAFWLANAATADAFAAPVLGKRRIVTYRPTSDSSVAWTKSTGASNFGVVDEAGYDITDYNSSATLNQEDLYGLADYDWITPIYSVQIAALGVLASGTSASLKASMKSSATTLRTTTGIALAALVAEAHIVSDTDPNGSIAWGTSGVNALTGGMQLSATAGAGTARVGQVFMEILADGSIVELLDQAGIVATSFALTETVNVPEALDQASVVLTSFPVGSVVTINEFLDAAGVLATSYDFEEFIIPARAVVQHVGRTDAPILRKTRGSAPSLRSVNRVLSALRRGRITNPKLGQ